MITCIDCLYHCICCSCDIEIQVEKSYKNHTKRKRPNPIRLCHKKQDETSIYQPICKDYKFWNKNPKTKTRFLEKYNKTK